MDLEQGLKAELSAIAGLNNKVFPLSAPEGTAAPYLVYSLNGTDRPGEIATGFAGIVNRRYQLNILHTSYGNLKALMRSVISLVKSLQMRNIAVTGPYIQQLNIDDEHEVYEAEIKLFSGIIDITVYHEE